MSPYNRWFMCFTDLSTEKKFYEYFELGLKHVEVVLNQEALFFSLFFPQQALPMGKDLTGL